MKITDLTLRQALELAATIEDEAAQRYEALAERFADDESVGPVFAQLANRVRVGGKLKSHTSLAVAVVDCDQVEPSLMLAD